MDKPMNVCVLVGSLRKASINRMLANALIVACAIFDEARHRRDRAIALFQ